MLRILQQARQDIVSGENIDVYLILLSSVVLAFLGAFGNIDPTIVTAGIFTVLSLLSVGILRLRHTSDELQKTLVKTKRTYLFEKQSLITPDRHEFEMARTIDWMAFSMYKTFSIYSKEIRQCLQSGGKIRVILINPNTHLPEDLLLLGYTADVEHLKSNVKSTITTLQRWQASIPDCQLEVRLLNSMPPYRVAILNRGTNVGRIRLRLFGTPGSEDVPTVILQRSNEPYWFDYFAEQYDRFWEIAKPVSLNREDSSLNTLPPSQ